MSKYGFVTLFTILVLCANAYAKEELLRTCADAGGLYTSGECWCSYPSVAINPAIESCFLISLKKVTEIQECECSTEISASSAGPQAQNCSDLASGLCNVETHKAMRELIAEASVRNQRYVEASRKAVQANITKEELDSDFIKREPNELAPCYVIKDENRIKNCYEMLDKTVKELNPDASVQENITKKIFEETKNDVLSYLDSLIARKSKSKEPLVVKQLGAVRKKISEATIQFGFGSVINAEAKDSTAGVRIETMNLHLLATKSPEFVRFTLMHEFGHLASRATNSYQYVPNENPFKQSTECLDTFIRPGDVACLKKVAAETKDPKKQQAANDAIESFKLNPYKQWDRTSFVYTKPLGCANPEYSEAFADWFGGAVLAHKIKNAKQGSVDVVAAIAGRCQEFNGQLRNPRELFDNHPTGLMRVQIFLANPIIRQEINCKGPVNLGKVAHCD